MWDIYADTDVYTSYAQSHMTHYWLHTKVVDFKIILTLFSMLASMLVKNHEIIIMKEVKGGRRARGQHEIKVKSIKAEFNDVNIWEDRRFT